MRTLTSDIFESRKPYRAMTGHHNKIGHRQQGKFRFGIGGINCPCCTRMHPTKLKPKYARYLRRKSKQELNKLVNEEN